MGYTHYWKKTKVTEIETWKKFKEFVANVVEKVKADGIDIKNGLGENTPDITDDRVELNGDSDKDFDHETFGIDRESTRGFDFCKTAYKPYDVVVVACLIEAERLGVVDEWSSDGDEADHKDGIKLHHSITEEDVNEEMTFSEVMEDICEALADLTGDELSCIAERYIDSHKYEYHGDGMFSKTEIVEA